MKYNGKKVVHKIFKKKKGHQAERLKHQSKGKSVKKILRTDVKSGASKNLYIEQFENA